MLLSRLWRTLQYQINTKTPGVDPAGQGSDRACRKLSVEKICQNWTKLYIQL